MTVATGKCRCEKCGKVFDYVYRGQRYCYDPCLPPTGILHDSMFNKRKVKTDCRMYRQLATGQECCTGLTQLFCGFEKCKFYKPKSK